MSSSSSSSDATSAVANTAAHDPHPARPIVLSGPSGTGKSTLLKKLFAEYPDRFGFSVSHTTRAPRPGEQDGVAYHFIPRATFDSLVASNAFIEHAVFGGNCYATSFKAVEAVRSQGRICVLDIEAQGVRQVKTHLSHLRPLYIFISPPSLSELRARLTNRGTESADSLAKRLQTAKDEIEYAQTGAHDLVIVNDSLDRAYGLLKKAVLGEQVTSDRLPDFDFSQW